MSATHDHREDVRRPSIPPHQGNGVVNAGIPCCRSGLTIMSSIRPIAPSLRLPPRALLSADPEISAHVAERRLDQGCYVDTFGKLSASRAGCVQATHDMPPCPRALTGPAAHPPARRAGQAPVGKVAAIRYRTDTQNCEPSATESALATRIGSGYPISFPFDIHEVMRCDRKLIV